MGKNKRTLMKFDIFTVLKIQIVCFWVETPCNLVGDDSLYLKRGGRSFPRNDSSYTQFHMCRNLEDQRPKKVSFSASFVNDLDQTTGQLVITNCATDWTFVYISRGIFVIKLGLCMLLTVILPLPTKYMQLRYVLF